MVDQNRAGPAFGEIATQLGSGEAQFPAKGAGVSSHDVASPALSIYVQTNQARTGVRRSMNAGSSKQVTGGGDGRAATNRTLYESAPRYGFGRIPEDGEM
jgi:hypothetical protein